MNKLVDHFVIHDDNFGPYYTLSSRSFELDKSITARQHSIASGFMRRITVLYFTVIPLSSPSNGGNISCRNHISRLRQDPNIEAHVVAAPVLSDVKPTQDFLDSVGGDHLVIPRRPSNLHQEQFTLAGALKFAFKAATHFPWEFEALNQPQYDEALEWAVRHWRADIVVIDYLFSTLFCPRIMAGPIKTALITQNREEQFHRDMIKLGLIKHDKITAELSARRLAKFERAMYEATDLLIALSDNDLPSYIPLEKRVSITPFLDPREPWRHSQTKSVFFVGNIGHFPNREAVEFIATALAPRLETSSPSVRIKIVGANDADVPRAWHHPKIDFLGLSDAETVHQLFTSSDAMICPINNTYGMKFKIAEAIAHCTPLIASSEALQCVPYLADLPTFDFNDADTAASIVKDVLSTKERAPELSRRIASASEEFIRSQKDRWSAVLAKVA